jgi:hypothetical protein
MKSSKWMYVALFAALAISVQLAAQDNPNHQSTFTTFDAPGAGTGSSQGTYPFAINPEGAITGLYVDASNMYHGFLRDRDGTLTAFDPNGSIFTSPSGINLEGTITGSYCYEGYVVCPGFVRDRDGTFTTFDVPNDANGTNPSGINLEGTITGSYCDVSFDCHGFLRDRHGTITTFDAPGVGTGYLLGTYPASINLEGAVSGCYTDANSVGHGFLRDRDGTMTTFDVLDGGREAYYYCSGFGGGFSGPGFAVNYAGAGSGLAINPEGAITGTYFQPIAGNPFGGEYRGFLRNPDGSFATFDAATYSPCCIWTFGIAINPAGSIAGYYNDGFNLNHGFLRDSDGTITTLDAPGAGTGTFQGTIADGINPDGQITGLYIDAGNVRHGFSRTKGCGQSPEVHIPNMR